MQMSNALSFAGLMLALAVSGSLGWTALWAAPLIGVIAVGLRSTSVRTEHPAPVTVG